MELGKLRATSDATGKHRISSGKCRSEMTPANDQHPKIAGRHPIMTISNGSHLTFSVRHPVVFDDRLRKAPDVYRNVTH